MMYSSLIILLSISTSVLAKQAVTNADSFGAMLKRGNAIAKRQGYYPDTSDCGVGDTCEEACGPNQVECPSNSLTTLYCHSSVDGSHCCTDGSGSTFTPLSPIILAHTNHPNRLLPRRLLLHVRWRGHDVLLPRWHRHA